MTAKESIAKYLPTMNGWCSPEKANAIVDLVLMYKPKLCVEIGVFAGKSAVATGFALREAGGGTFYGIDPWRNPDCCVDENTLNRKWWTDVNLEDIYDEFCRKVKEYQLESWVKHFRMTSLEASVKFRDQEIDLLHIDGNHSEWSSTTDVCIWLPKLADGGYLMMDDVNWESTQTAQRFAAKFCERLSTTETKESHFAIFRKK